MDCVMVKRAAPSHGEIAVERDPSMRRWFLTWREPLGDVRVAVADDDVEWWPGRIEGRNRAHCAYQIAAHPAVMAVFYRRLPPGEVDGAREPRVIETTRTTFTEIAGSADDEPPFPGGSTKVELRVYGGWTGMSSAERSVRLADAIARGVNAGLGRVPLADRRAFGVDAAHPPVDDQPLLRAACERGPSAAAAAPPVQRGPVVFCQSQFDPDE
jgi:hypothetical protein